jgi:hypothetical protein
MTPITTPFDFRSTVAEVANGIDLSGKRATSLARPRASAWKQREPHRKPQSPSPSVTSTWACSVSRVRRVENRGEAERITCGGSLTKEFQ